MYTQFEMTYSLIMQHRYRVDDSDVLGYAGHARPGYPLLIDICLLFFLMLSYFPQLRLSRLNPMTAHPGD